MFSKHHPCPEPPAAHPLPQKPRAQWQPGGWARGCHVLLLHSSGAASTWQKGIQARKGKHKSPGHAGSPKEKAAPGSDPRPRSRVVPCGLFHLAQTPPLPISPRSPGSFQACIPEARCRGAPKRHTGQSQVWHFFLFFFFYVRGCREKKWGQRSTSRMLRDRRAVPPPRSAALAARYRGLEAG